MPTGQLIFLAFAVFTVGAAVRVVTHRQVFHAALWLIASFFGIAAVYLLLESPFMAGVQLFIYIGGVAVLTVIAVMVTKGMMRRDLPTMANVRSSALVAVSLFVVMSWTILQMPLPEAPASPLFEEGLAMLGMALVDPRAYLLPFEVISVMLLIVLIGALYLARER